MESIGLSSGPASPAATRPGSPRSRPTTALTSDSLDAVVQMQAAEGAFRTPPGEAVVQSGPTAAPQRPPARQGTPEPAPESLPSGASPQATGRATGAGPSPWPAMDAEPVPPPQAPITLTAAQAQWVPRWFLRGMALAADSAVPSWMNAGRRAISPAALLSRSVSDLGSLEAGSWHTSFGPPSPRRLAEAPVWEGGDAGSGSGGCSPDMQSARSSASWLVPGSEADDASDVDPADASWACGSSSDCGLSDLDLSDLDLSDLDLSDSRPGHLDLPSLSSVSAAHPQERAGFWTRSLSSGSVSSLASLSSTGSSRGESIADPQQAATSESSRPFSAQLNSQDDESSATSSPSRRGSRSSSPPPGAVRHEDRPDRSREAPPAPVPPVHVRPEVRHASIGSSRGESIADPQQAATSESSWPFSAQLKSQDDESSATSTPSRRGSRSSSPPPGAVRHEDRPDRSREAPPAPVPPVHVRPEVRHADSPVDVAYAAVERAINADILLHVSFRSRYDDLKQAMAVPAQCKPLGSRSFWRGRKRQSAAATAGLGGSR